tara:strand:- start:5987 stop:6568 length:582 start_codon:yes stop_codon:yes gene_type:complete
MQVLALDLSYVMAPSISEYDSFPCSTRISPEKHWDAIRHSTGKDRFAFSLERLGELIRVFSKALKNIEQDQIHWVMHQSDVLPVLVSCDHLTIHNIDHHHDIESQSLDMAGWVHELDRQKLVDEYTWWRNRNSKNINEDMLNCSYGETTFSKRQPMKNPDVVIISRSPLMVPPELQGLYDIFQGMACSWFNSH